MPSYSLPAPFPQHQDASKVKRPLWALPACEIRGRGGGKLRAVHCDGFKMVWIWRYSGICLIVSMFSRRLDLDYGLAYLITKMEDTSGLIDQVSITPILMQVKRQLLDKIYIFCTIAVMHMASGMTYTTAQTGILSSSVKCLVTEYQLYRCGILSTIQKNYYYFFFYYNFLVSKCYH